MFSSEILFLSHTFRFGIPMPAALPNVPFHTSIDRTLHLKSFFNTEMLKFHHSTAICKNIVNDFMSKFVTPRAEWGLSSQQASAAIYDPRPFRNTHSPKCYYPPKPKFDFVH
jgi:hypothetical protein